MAKVDYLPENSLWDNRKCLLICAAVAVASMQYGLDTGVVAALQAMPGFLIVFGYEDPSQPGGYGIEVGWTPLRRPSPWSPGLPDFP